MIDILWLLLAFALVLLNAFFVAAEFGMVKLRHTRVAVIQKTHGFKGQILATIHRHLDAYLSACQLGITLASLGLGWVGEPAVAHLLHPLFMLMGITPQYASIIAFLIAFSVLSFLHIVIGELMPKSMAIRQSEKISIWTALPLYGFYWVMFPAIWLLNTCSNGLLKLFGLSNISPGEHFHSTDEIKLILSASQLHGELAKEEAKILEHTLDFADLKVTEVMRGREDMIQLDIRQPIDDIMSTIMKHRYSRYPIYDSQHKKIIGIIHVKDLFAKLYQDQNLDDIKSIIRPVLKVSYKLPALNLLKHFREGMPHFALVYSKKETLIGFVTLDNLLHVLIGRIKDEFHRTHEDWQRLPDGNLRAKGDCALFSLEQALGHDIDTEDEAIETLSGLIYHQLGSIPKEGQSVHFPTFKATITKMKGTRISWVEITLLKPRH